MDWPRYVRSSPRGDERGPEAERRLLLLQGRRTLAILGMVGLLGSMLLPGATAYAAERPKALVVELPDFAFPMFGVPRAAASERSDRESAGETTNRSARAAGADRRAAGSSTLAARSARQIPGGTGTVRRTARALAGAAERGPEIFTDRFGPGTSKNDKDGKGKDGARGPEDPLADLDLGDNPLPLLPEQQAALDAALAAAQAEAEDEARSKQEHEQEEAEEQAQDEFEEARRKAEAEALPQGPRIISLSDLGLDDLAGMTAEELRELFENLSVQRSLRHEPANAAASRARAEEPATSRRVSAAERGYRSRSDDAPTVVLHQVAEGGGSDDGESGGSGAESQDDGSSGDGEESAQSDSGESGTESSGDDAGDSSSEQPVADPEPEATTTPATESAAPQTVAPSSTTSPGGETTTTPATSAPTTTAPAPTTTPTPVEGSTPTPSAPSTEPAEAPTATDAESDPDPGDADDEDSAPSSSSAGSGTSSPAPSAPSTTSVPGPGSTVTPAPAPVVVVAPPPPPPPPPVPPQVLDIATDTLVDGADPVEAPEPSGGEDGSSPESGADDEDADGDDPTEPGPDVAVPAVEPLDPTPSDDTPTPSTPGAASGAGSGSAGTGTETPGADGAGAVPPITDPGAGALPPLAPVLTTPTGPSTPGAPRGPPPAGSVLVLATQGGTVTVGNATLTFVPGSLPSDAYVIVSVNDLPVPGTSILSGFDLHAYDAVTGESIETFLAPPLLTISVGDLGGRVARIYYVDPVSGAVAMPGTYDAATGTVTAALPHFSHYQGTSLAVVNGAVTQAIAFTGSAVTITDHAHAGEFDVVVDGVTTVVINAGSVTTLTVNGTAGGNVLTIASIDSAFAGTIVFDGNGGTDLLVGLDAAGRWSITGIDSGDWEGQDQPKVEFSEVESITGAATKADAFDFDSGAGLSGTIVDGAGDLTVSVAGFVKVTGDFDFTRQTVTVTYRPTSGASSGGTTTATVLKIGGTSGTGFVGVEPLGHAIGLEGELERFGLAVVTGGGKAWHVFEGTISDPVFVGLADDLDTGAADLTVAVNDTSDGTYLDLSGTPISFGSDSPVVLDFTTGLVSASTTIVLTIGDFVHVSGVLSIGLGSPVQVDVKTGLPASNPIGETIEDVWVSQLKIAATDVNVFVGYSPDLEPGADDIVQRSELSADAIGLWVEDVDFGLVLMAALPAPTNTAAVALLGLRFFAVTASAAAVELVGVPGLTLSASGIEIGVNGGRPLAVGAPAAVVDFASSFPTGYTIETGGEDLEIDYSDAVIGASADKVTLRVLDFVYVTGSFSFNQGRTEAVDVKTGLTSVEAATQLGTIPISATDPTDGSLARTQDGSIIWNLPTQTLNVGIGSASAFFGYSEGLDGPLEDGVLEIDDFEDTDAVGLLINQLTLGLALFDVLPVDATLLTNLNNANLSFFALQANAEEIAMIGVPELVLEGTGIEVRVNHGSFFPGLAGARPPPVVDFLSSFPSDGTDPGTEPDGYLVPIDTSGATVPLTFDGALIAAGAENLTIQISQFVYVSGAIYFEKGTVKTVTVTTLVGDIGDLLEDVGLPAEIAELIGLEQDVEFLTIGARDLHAFVGVGGPYWVDANGNGVIDRGPNGQILASEVNPDAIGLVIDDLDFGLALGTPVNRANPMRYLALKGSAELIALVGIPGVTATIEDLEVELNLSSPTVAGLPLLPVIDFGEIDDGLGYRIKTGAKKIVDGVEVDDTIDLLFDSPLIRASVDWINLDLFGVVSVQGAVAFSLGAPVKLADNSTVTTMTVGARDVSAFVGYGGPYVTDRNGGRNPNAVGIHISDLDLGLFIGLEALSTDPDLYVAAKLSIEEFGIVGVPGLELDGTLAVELNLGSDLLTGGPALNFLTAFPDTDGAGTEDRAGFEVDTGDPANPVLLDFTGFLVDVQLAGYLKVAGVARVVGAFRFQADSAGLKVFAAGSLEFGQDIEATNKLLDVTALGVLIVNADGVAGDLDVDFALGTDDVGLSVSARVLLNTTGADQSIVIPDRLIDAINDSGSPLAALLLDRLTTCGGEGQCYTVRAGAPKIFSSPGVPDLDAVAILLGEKTGTVQYENPGDYVVAILAGDFNFLGLASGEGLAAVSVRAGAFEMIAELEFTIGPLSFDAEGSLGLYRDGVALDVAIALDVDMLNLFHLGASGRVKVNTVGSNDYFRLELSGDISVLSVIGLSGGLVVEVDNGAWRIAIPETDKLTADYGPLGIEGWGEIRSTGYFDLHFAGEIDLSAAGSGIVGAASVHASFNPATGAFAFSVGGSFSAKLAGIDLFGVEATGSVTGVLGQTVTLKVNVRGTGLFWEVVEKVVRVTKEYAERVGAAIVNFLGSIGCEIASWFGACDEWVEIKVQTQEQQFSIKGFELVVATFTLPGSLGTLPPPPPANLATLIGGVLYLNVGDEANGRGANRGAGAGQTAEALQIVHIGGTAASETVRVIGFGRDETFTGVTRIVGYFGSGQDSLLVGPGVLVAIEAHGGTGNDTVTHQGSGAAQLYGDDGNDSLSIGAATVGTLASLILDGGEGNDLLLSASSSPVTLRGGAGNDTLTGGAGNDALYGGSGDDTIEGRGGTDASHGEAGNDVLRELLANLVGGETFFGGADADRIELTGGDGADDVRVAPGAGGVVIGRYAPSLAGSLTLTGTEKLVLAGGAGSDRFLIDGSLDAGGLDQVTIDLGSGGADRVDVKLSAGNDSASLSTQAAGPSGPASLTVNWSGQHAITVTGASPADGDVLAVDALGGNDALNGAGVIQVLFDRVDLTGGAGNDVLIGTPDDDVIDGGTGNDVVSGLGGTDTFVDASGLDRISEVAAADFGLYGNLLVIGTALVSGSGESRTVTGFTSATAEDTSVFEEAFLYGLGAERNVFAVGSAGASITVNGPLRSALADFAGLASFHGLGGNDEYVIELAGVNGGSVDVLEEGASAGGTDTLVIKGTSGVDLGTLTSGALSAGVATLLLSLAGPSSAATLIRFSGRVDTRGLYLAGGDDRLAVRSLSLATALDAGAGDDAILVGSAADAAAATNVGGTLESIDAPLTVAGGAGTDELSIDDSGELSDSTGVLTAALLTGLGLDPAGVGYGGFEELEIALGAGDDAFSIVSTHSGTSELDTGSGEDAIDVRAISGHTLVAAGAGADTVRVGSTAPTAGGTLDSIDALLTVGGGDGTDALLIDDSGDAGANTGVLTASALAGLGLSSAGLGYGGFESLTLGLGSGGDSLRIDSTHGGGTVVNAGGGDDTVVLETSGGPVRVNGENGADTITVNALNGSPSTLNGLLGRVTLDGSAGSDRYFVNGFGNGDSVIDVDDSGTGDDDRLRITGTGAADQFLLREDLVALLSGFDGGGFDHAERVLYDEAVEGLTVDGAGGDDRFALDDNSAPTTIEGGTGADVFQVGQLFGLEVSFESAVDVTTTTRGLLSNGATHATTINGGVGNDRFSIFHNLAEMQLNGDAGDDEFVVRTFLAIDEQTTVDAGEGLDVVRYVNNAPLAVNGGDGFDRLVVIGTEADDVFVITATVISGAGVSVTYTGVEAVDVDGAEGDDVFLVLATRAGVSTRIFGGLGSDTTTVSDPGSVDGNLHVEGGPDPEADRTIPAPVLLPGETSSPLPVLDDDALDVIEAAQVDALLVLAGAVTAGQTATLAADRLTGLGMGPGGVTYAGLEALVLELGAGADVVTVEGTHGGTTHIDTAAGDDRVGIRALGGHTLLETGSGDDLVTVGDGVRSVDAIAALLAVSGGAGEDLLVVDDSADGDSNLGTLTQTSVTGLDMVARSTVDRLFSLTLGAGASTFTVDLGPLGSVTLPAGSSAAALEAALEAHLHPAAACGTGGASRCADSVFVWALGDRHLIGFQGELRSALAPALTATASGSTATDLLRLDGVDYAGFEGMRIGLGTGHDRFNVRGTAVATRLDTGAGDDLVYVSDAADLGALPAAIPARDLALLHEAILHGTITVDDLTFEGSLDDVEGALTIEAGAGSNALAISDRGDPDADRTVILDAGRLTGLAPASIAFGATGGDLAGQGHWALGADTGLFGRGITVYGGSGGNHVTIRGLHASASAPAPLAATVTTVLAGEGADTVLVAVPAGPGVILAVHGQGGDDLIDGTLSSLPLVLIGDAGADVVRGGAGSDALFGDGGRAVLARPAGAPGHDVVLGGAPTTAVLADTDFLTLDALYTAGTGGSGDLVAGGAGHDAIFGGGGSDTLLGDAGDDVLVGDHGHATVRSGRVDAVTSSAVADGPGDDLIYGALGDDRLWGGPGADEMHGSLGSDRLWGDAGDDVLLGDLGTVTPRSGALAPALGSTGAGAKDVLLLDAGILTATLALAGLAPTRALAAQLVLADLVLVAAAQGATGAALIGPDGRPDLRLLTVDLLAGGNDELNGGAGNDALFGQRGNDRLYGEAGDDHAIGGTGDDVVEGGEGNDVLVGDEASVHTGDGAAPNVLKGLLIVGPDGLYGRLDGTPGPGVVPLATVVPGHDLDLFGSVLPHVSGGPRSLPAENWLAGAAGARLVPLFSLVPAIAGHQDQLAGHDQLAGGAGDDLLTGDDLTLLSGTVDLTDQATVIRALDVAWRLLDAVHRTGALVHDLHHVAADLTRLPTFGVVTDATIRLGADRLDGGEGADVLAGDDTAVATPTIRTSAGLARDVHHFLHDLDHAGHDLLEIGRELVEIEHRLRDRVRTVVKNRKPYSHVEYHRDALVVGQDALIGAGGDDLLVGDDRLHLAPSIVLSAGGTPVPWPHRHDHDHDGDDDDGWDHHGHWHHHHGDDDDDGHHHQFGPGDLVTLGDDALDGAAGNDLLFGDSQALATRSVSVAPGTSSSARGEAERIAAHLAEAGHHHGDDDDDDHGHHHGGWWGHDHHGDDDDHGHHGPAGGRDTLIGGDGHDVLFGQHGDDTLRAGAGDDWLIGGDGSDTLEKGTGVDRLHSGENSSSTLRSIVAQRLGLWSGQFRAFGTARGLVGPSPFLTVFDLSFDDDDDDHGHHGGLFVLRPRGPGSDDD